MNEKRLEQPLLTLTHRQYLAVALPFVFLNLTTPLLGAVDTAAIGQLREPALIAAVAVATMIFNTILWLFGFLRMSTSAFVAQAVGAKKKEEEWFAVSRPLLFAWIISFLVVVLQVPIEKAALALMNPGNEVAVYVSIYYGIRIWSIPISLTNYVLMGWLMGKGLVRKTVLLQIGLNMVNIGLNIWFVLGLNWGIQGVAWATVVAEMFALVIGLFFVKQQVSAERLNVSWKKTFDVSALWNMLKMNRDLFIRTICLLFVFNVFTAKGADFGTDILAANAILLQVHFLMAAVFDGFANATSMFTGRAVGAKSNTLYRDILKKAANWSWISGGIVALLFYLLQQPLLQLFTNTDEIVMLAEKYAWWIVLFPLTAASGLIFFGIFTGATYVKPVRNSILQAAVLFFLVYILAIPPFGNHGLWCAFIIFSLSRSVFLVPVTPRNLSNEKLGY
ncbi:MATE family efflux transporter [Bacillus sp. REN10]|uniref:MATE family efflux transporter n=1 Tax=Bacillus sp. REN10 TaxID=2782541 RepID=UPI00193AE4FB|nr:MATE family efflux transporter [Bacillus sp. REN10]